MAIDNISNATTTDFSSQVPDFIVNSISLDRANPGNTESYWYFGYAPEYYGYALSIPEIFSAASSLCTWATGRGYKAKNGDIKAILDHVVGSGKDSFGTIMWNHLFNKLIIGDAFMEIKRADSKGRSVVVNLIPYSPERVRIVFNKKDGLLKRYDVWNGDKWVEVDKKNMLHSINKRIGDQVHGTSQIGPSKKVIDARNEAFDDERVIKHRDKALGIVYYKTDKTGKITYANTQIENGVKNGEMVGLPEGTAKIEPWPSKSSEDRQSWISYLENFFYQIFGVPRSIASSDGTSEVGGKMGHVIFEPIYSKEQQDLEDDLRIQAQIEITFNRPPSLGGLMSEEMQKNSTTNIQPNDVGVTLNRE